jgi:hypothetical protein
VIQQVEEKKETEKPKGKEKEENDTTKEVDLLSLISSFTENKEEAQRNIETERSLLRKAFIASLAIEFVGSLIITTGITVTLVKGITFELVKASIVGSITAGWLITAGIVTGAIGTILSSWVRDKERKIIRQIQQKSES